MNPRNGIAIDNKGIVTVNVIRAEMGQHVGTSLARILADELEAPWEKVRIHHVDSDPKWGLMVTGGSWSVWQTYPLYSQAGAAGRAALIEAGATALGVDPATCSAANGEVISGDKKISYKDIVRKGVAKTYTPEELAKIAFKPVSRPQAHRQTGHLARHRREDHRRCDLRHRCEGRGHGLWLPDPAADPQRHAGHLCDGCARQGDQRLYRDRRPEGPVQHGARLVHGHRRQLARREEGRRCRRHRIPARPDDQRLREGHPGSRRQADRRFAKAPSSLPATPTRPPPSSSAKSTLDATYTTATALHFQMEPLNALALQKDGKWEIHTGNQWQSLVLPWLATALEVPETDVVMKTYRLGGGFGRRLNGDYAVGAALASKASGKPVKMVMTREDDVKFDSVRSPSVQKMRMGFDKDGNVIAMEQHVAAGWPTEVMAPFFMPKGEKDVPFDPFAINGANHWYTVGAHKVRAISNDLASATFRPGWLRSVGPGFTNWALESFIDEAAHKLKYGPRRLPPETAHRRRRQRRLSPQLGRRRHRVRPTWCSSPRRKPAGARSSRQAQASASPPPSARNATCRPWVACVARVNVDKGTGNVKVEKLDACRRRRHNRRSGRRLRADGRRLPVGPLPRPARRHRVR